MIDWFIKRREEASRKKSLIDVENRDAWKYYLAIRKYISENQLNTYPRSTGTICTLTITIEDIICEVYCSSEFMNDDAYCSIGFVYKSDKSLSKMFIMNKSDAEVARQELNNWSSVVEKNITGVMMETVDRALGV